MADHQKSREGQSVSDETVATYTAAKGFLIGEWFGAVLMVLSFTLLYALGLRPDADVRTIEIAGFLLFVVGTWAYWKSRGYYLALDFPWKRRWEVAATVVAGTGVVFWLMFLVALFLAWRGVAVF